MSGGKEQAPAAVVVPSYADAIDHLKSSKVLKKSLSVGNSRFSSGVVQPFVLPSDSLDLPVDPGFLDGASSQARFGLDIGGTLCKVVYFEPAVDLIKDFSRTPTTDGSTEDFINDKMGNDKLAQFAKSDEEGGRTDANGESQPRNADSLKKSADKVRNGYIGNGKDREAVSLRVNHDNATDLMTVGVDHLTIKNTEGLTPRSPRKDNTANILVGSSYSVENGKGNGGNGRTTDSVSESSQCNCGTPSVQVSGRYKDDRDAGGAGGAEDDQNSQKQVKKIWVSSHDPVHLPGRGTVYFKCFETWRMEEFLSLTKEYHLMSGGRAIGATGGGARKFGDKFLEIAGLQLQRADELKSLVRGIDFLARHAQEESFEYITGSYQGGSIQRPWDSPEHSSDDRSDISSEEEFSLTPCGEESDLEVSASINQVRPSEMRNRMQKEKAKRLKGQVLARLDSGVWLGSNEPLHPYLVVNIGSGVSILRVDSPDKFERVGGTSLGGSTFLGLANALTGCQSFEEAISLAMQGDSTHVDMLVGDIYGGDYTEMGLAATTVASSFGKLAQPQRNVETEQPHHLAKAALLMVTNNIGSIALLHARNAGASSIMFTGSFLHNNKLAMRLLAVAMDFWSKGNTKAVFLRHEGHAGAIGALLSPLDSSNSLDALLLT